MRISGRWWVSNQSARAGMMIKDSALIFPQDGYLAVLAGWLVWVPWNLPWYLSESPKQSHLTTTPDNPGLQSHHSNIVCDVIIDHYELWIDLNFTPSHDSINKRLIFHSLALVVAVMSLWEEIGSCEVTESSQGESEALKDILLERDEI